MGNRKRQSRQNNPSQDDALDGEIRAFLDGLRGRATAIVLETIGDGAPREVVEGVLDFWRNLPPNEQIAQGLFPPGFKSGEWQTPIIGKAYRAEWESIFRRIVAVEGKRNYYRDAATEEDLPSNIREFVNRQRAYCDLYASISRGGWIRKPTPSDSDVHLGLIFPPTKRPRHDIPLCAKVLAVETVSTLRRSAFKGKCVVLTQRLLETLDAYRTGAKSNPRDFAKMLKQWSREVDDARQYTRDRLPAS